MELMTGRRESTFQAHVWRCAVCGNERTYGSGVKRPDDTKQVPEKNFSHLNCTACNATTLHMFVSYRLQTWRPFISESVLRKMRMETKKGGTP